MTNEECLALPEAEKKKGQDAVEQTVIDKIENFLLSANKAKYFKS